MHKSTSPKRNSFTLYALGTALLVIAGSAAALAAGVTPSEAAQLARQPDAQIAIFMVPLTLLVLAVMVEVTRMVVRGKVPVELPVASPRRPPLSRQRSSR